jgi:hypothetical protein
MGEQDGLRWPPAWYADPLGRHDHRWWDGAAWTAHVADAGVAGRDPVELAPAPPSGVDTVATSVPSATSPAGPTSGAATWGATSATSPLPRRNEPMALAALVVGLVALPLALVPFIGLAAAVTALVLALVGRSRIRRDGSSGDGMAVTGLVASIGALVLSLIVTVTTVVVLSGLGGGLSDAFREYVACLEVRSEDECRALFEATMLRSMG